MFHSKKPKKLRFADGHIVHRDFKTENVEIDGVVTNQICEFEDDYSERPELIKPEDFTLKIQLQSGMILKQVNTSTLLSPTDPSDVNNLNEDGIINDLNNLPSIESPLEPTHESSSSDNDNK